MLILNFAQQLNLLKVYQLVLKTIFKVVPGSFLLLYQGTALVQYMRILKPAFQLKLFQSHSIFRIVFYYFYCLKVEFPLYIQPPVQYQVKSVMLWENQHN